MNSTNILPTNNTYYASFFDLDENGQLDVIIVSKNETNYEIRGYYNNYIYDAFFLKSVTLLNKNYFTTNELGTNYRYIATNLDGSRRMDVSFQGIQTSDLYLNLPYSFIGIGRSNNYIENFHVISNTHAPGQENYKIFTPIIPNSQLIIFKQFHTEEDPPYM
jgi:integrin alpha FG-GAP repeat containing protein 1